MPATGISSLPSVGVIRPPVKLPLDAVEPEQPLKIRADRNSRRLAGQSENFLSVNIVKNLRRLFVN
jgi:hypothetical protein